MHVLLLHHVVEDRWPSNSRWVLPSFSFPFFCTVHGILQARILEWVAIPILQGIFPTQGSNSGLPHCRQILYHLSHQGSPRILECILPSPEDLPNPGIEPKTLALQADSLLSEPPGKPKNTGVCAAAAKSLQSCPTLCDPIDGSPPGSRVTYPFSRGTS